MQLSKMELSVIVNYFLFSSVAVTVANHEYFTIDTEGCKIPAYPLETRNIQSMMMPPSADDVDCRSKVKPLVKANSTHIWVVQGLENFYQIQDPSEFYCCYRNFSARRHLDNVGYGVCEYFTNGATKANDEFLRVECYNDGEKIYEDIFRFNVYEKRKSNRLVKSPFNVIMFGIDSISRKNFLRTMPKTAKFLKTRGSIQLLGYNKLGEGSFPNIFPLLSGISYEIAINTCFGKNVYKRKACPFIWDLFRKAGYQTALGSDSGIGVLGAYESLLRYKPTTYYLQTFMYETRHTYKDMTYDYHICLQDRYMYKELLQFADDVITATAHDDKLFALFWEESVSHHGVNYPYILDSDYSNILHDMEKKNILKDTIVILVSDHGTKFGEILNTEEGRQESRLPLLEVLLPAKFRHQYKMAYKNFEINSRRLTTAYDVHETLLDLINTSALEDSILKERAASTNENAVSLFLPLPTNRTCISTNIPAHWCTCLSGDIITIGAKGQAFTVKYLLRYINQILNEYPQCRKLFVEKVIEVTAIKDDSLSKRTFRVLVQTKPGGGIFEGTLVQERKTWHISGSVSRLNSYKNQSHCVKDPFIKSYCYCVKQ